jgi:CubicO group peptidase (beta-lactamase class C family)
VALQEELAAMINPIVAAGAMAGAATLVWRDGQVVQAGGFGWRDAEARLPVERDTLFRIASMTKPITSVAALMLAEEGRFALEDSITRWAPELAQMRVVADPRSPLDSTVPAARPITFLDLLTHRSGLSYEFLSPGPLGAAYEAALGGMIDSDVAPDDWIARLAALPLVDEPGAGFHYGRSTDLLGFLIARIADKPFQDVLAERIFQPLGMKDTAFSIPADEHLRRAEVYGFDDAGRLAARPIPERPEGMAYVSAGQGLWSTLDDFLAFARLFLGDGSVDGVRLLKSETLERMMNDQLTDEQRIKATIFGAPLFAAHGFGLGVSIVRDSGQPSPYLGGGGKGAVSWGGSFGGWWQADPSADQVLIFLTHVSLAVEQMAKGIGIGAFGARMQFEAIARGAKSGPMT